MSKQSLVIVESPAKARTIERYLGSGYTVVASFGHVRDLPAGKMGVDTEKNYEPSYIVPTKTKKTVSMLKKAVSSADQVYLATDPDREGEAIAWHITQAVGLEKTPNPKSQIPNRITFTSITKEAVNEAITKPRALDMDLIDAQQARRVIDRLVGYSLSPVLWRKIYKGLSAGRVQSVAVRLVVEREREIEAFKPVEYWSVEADLKKGSSAVFTAFLIEFDGKKIEKLTVGNKKDADAFLRDLERAKYVVIDVKTHEEKRTPPPPFITSTLQQEASRRFGWSAKQTMRVAQGLYESGHITYMRTDSHNVVPQAVAATRKYIESSFGDKYLPAAPRVYTKKAKLAQEAHEAIRPTYPGKAPRDMGGLDAKAAKLYDLIWCRMIASQMIEARYENTAAIIEARASKTGIFKATGIRIVFDGWRKVYGANIGDETKVLPKLETKDALDLEKLRAEEHFTEPPGRYSEASLIKALEERGIGRPSTYAPTMATIIDRGYVRREKGRLHPEDIGKITNDLLVKHFADIVDYDFTAKIENELDDVADGKLVWTKVVGEIYEPLNKQIKSEEGKIEKVPTHIETDEKCPECGKPIVIKRGKFGQFYACTGFPECRYTKPFLTEAEEAIKDKAEARAKEGKCPQCQSELVARKGKFGWFVGCSTYPKCKFIENVK